VKLKDLENLKHSTTKDLNKNKKIFLENESLKAKCNSLLVEKKQLNQKVKQMLKKIEIIQPY
jgi:regulator of replication initiation timing